MSYRSWETEHSSAFFDLASSAYYMSHVEDRQGEGLMYSMRLRPGGGEVGPTSPFSCLVEEIFNVSDRELQNSMFHVIWFEKLVFWKIGMFARKTYLIRFVLPLLLNMVLHMAISIIAASGHKTVASIPLAALQAGLCLFLTLQKVRQAHGTILFYRSIYNYIDLIVIGLSLAMCVQVLARRTPPRPFIAYSIPVLWIDLVLATRVYEQSGVLMILVTEMIRGVFPFLGLLSLFIIGESLAFCSNYTLFTFHRFHFRSLLSTER